MPYTMTPTAIRALLTGYNLDEKTITYKTGDTVLGDDTISNIDVTGLEPYQFISGAGIPADAYIVTVGTTSIDISCPATANGTTVVLTITGFTQLPDSWIVEARDYEVIPWIEAKTRVSFSGVQQTTEYHSGTSRSILILGRKPIVSLDSINLITNPDNWVYVSPSSCEIVAAEGIIKLKTVLESWQSYVPAFPRGSYNIKVTYHYGYATVPDPLYRIVNLLVASRVLGHLGARTGGGPSLSTNGYTRTFGERGKYSDIRTEMERMAVALLRLYMTGVNG